MNFKIMMTLVSLIAAPAMAQEAAPLPALDEQVLEQHLIDAAFTKVETYFNTVTTLKATFLQKNSNGTIARGNMLLSRPGKIRFDYTDNYPYLIVSDGRILNMVDFEIGKVTKWPIKDTPLKMLLGKGVDLAAYGAVVEPNPGGAEGIIAVTASNPEKREEGEITLYFIEKADAVGGLVLDSWRVLDGQGKVTQIALNNQEANAEMGADAWTFEDPRGSSKRNKGRRR